MQPYHPIRSFRGKGGRDAAVAVRRNADGPITSVDVDVVNILPLRAFSDATLASARVIERDGRRIGYVHVWASVGDVPQMVSQSLERLGLTRSSDHKKAPTVPAVDGLIFDMRGKIGGMVGVATQYLELLDPRGPDITWRGSGRDVSASVRGRTAVLMDHHTRSTGEVFVHSYKRERQGPLIGTTTAGAVSGGAALNMPADCLLHVAVSGLVVDGDIIEGRGVAPDITVQRPLRLLRRRRPGARMRRSPSLSSARRGRLLVSPIPKAAVNDLTRGSPSASAHLLFGGRRPAGPQGIFSAHQEALDCRSIRGPDPIRPRSGKRS